MFRELWSFLQTGDPSNSRAAAREEVSEDRLLRKTTRRKIEAV
jgi:hypothetical protein